MKYYKISNGGVISIGTVDEDGFGNINEEEYNEILSMLTAMPDGKTLKETEEGYEYNDIVLSDEDIPDSDALHIITGGEI